MKKIIFVSSNKYKIKEVQNFFNGTDIKIIPESHLIEELQTQDVQNLVKDKALKAFRKFGHPLIVDHTSLYITALNGFPGGLTQIFWDSLGPDNFASLVGKFDDRKAIAKTTIGYCDGVNITLFEGKIDGHLIDKPMGDREFQWDCVFIPEGSFKTFAELLQEKKDISMRTEALNKLKDHLS